MKLENAWQSLMYSPLGTVVSPPANTNETYLLIAALPITSPSTERT